MLKKKRENGRGTRKTYGISEFTVLFFIISFIGWGFEKIGRYFMYNSLADRGFLTMPMCPIYGFSILAIYLILGTPYSPKIGIRRSRSGCGRTSLSFLVNIFLYFLLSCLIATALEFGTGIFFERVVGVTLWNYDTQPYDLFGYICLGFSLLWGGLITAFMLSFWGILYRLVGRIPKRATGIIAVILTFLAIVDMIFNLIYIDKIGAHFNFL